MRILAIDTALGLCSAAVFDIATGARLSGESLAMDRGHAEALLPLIERTINRVEGRFQALERVAVSVGPGSFTGLRVGLAAGRAIGLGLGIPVVGVSTLSAFAGPFIGKDDAELVVSLVDARHDHVYLQAVSSEGRIVAPPGLVACGDAVALIGNARARLAGNATALLGGLLNAAGHSFVTEGDQIGPDIAWIARLGAAARPELSPPTPLYLKPPDAAPQTNGRIARL